MSPEQAQVKTAQQPDQKKADSFGKVIGEFIGELLMGKEFKARFVNAEKDEKVQTVLLPNWLTALFGRANMPPRPTNLAQAKTETKEDKKSEQEVAYNRDLSDKA